MDEYRLHITTKIKRNYWLIALSYELNAVLIVKLKQFVKPNNRIHLLAI